MDKEQLPRGRKIMVVDDNRDAANALAALLKLYGQDVQQVYDGASAIKTAGEFHPEIVFLDLVMPNMDGFDVLSQLRDQEQMHNSRMIVVALTAFGQPAFREATRESGFDRHLLKPASAEEVLAILKAH